MEIQYKILPKVEASDRLNRLFSELYGEEITADAARINDLISSGKLVFYSAWLDGNLVGMASVIPCRTSLYNKFWIEDVAVLSECRGLGVGRGIVEFTLKDASSRFGEGTFWLTSRPSRIAARTLYASLGFKEYETGIFRLDFSCFPQWDTHFSSLPR